MALTRQQKSQLSRYKNNGHHATYLTANSISKEQFEATSEEEQLKELESYIKENKLKLKKVTKIELEEKEEENTFISENYVSKIIHSTNLNSDAKIEKLKSLEKLKEKDEEIEKITKKIESLRNKIVKLEQERQTDLTNILNFQ